MAAIGLLAETILETLNSDLLRNWILRVKIDCDMDMLGFEVEKIGMVYAAAKERASGNKLLGRSLARLEDLLYDADDLVDELDYYRLLESSSTVGSSSSVVGQKDTPIQSTNSELLDMPDSPATDLSDYAWRQEDMKGDMDIESTQVDKKLYAECKEPYGSIKQLKFIHCGFELDWRSRDGPQDLQRHIQAACRWQKSAAAEAAGFSYGTDNAQRVQEEILGAVRMDEKSRGDRNGRKSRSPIWEHFLVSERDATNRAVKAKCVHCGKEFNYDSKQGTSGLRRHIYSASCAKEKIARNQPLNPSSNADGSKNAEAVTLANSHIAERKRMDDESTNKTKANKHYWNEAKYLHRIQEITRQVQGISRLVSQVLKLHASSFVSSSNCYRSTTSNRHLRTSSLVRNKIYGRVTEKNYIINLMTKEKPDGICVLPIVSIAGVGKTALAQLVYNDPNVAEYFDQRIWVCVSNNFDEVRLSREILEFISPERHEGLCSFAKLQEVLKIHFTSKRILLILDDVWDDVNFWRWSQLLAPLESNAAKGTVVLLTTRNLSVAQTVGTVEPIKLQSLLYEDFLLLFKACAFGNENYTRNQSLSTIGLQIAERLNGNPLAAETAGQLLRLDLTIDHWKNILKNEDWNSLQLSGGIMSALKLSYDQLPYHLQQCFSYCSIFPQKYPFIGEDLVNIWISQGLVECHLSSHNLEEEGITYLVALVNLGFIQQVEREETYPVSQTFYVICGLMHDFARAVSRTKCATIDGMQCYEMLPTIRHLSILTDSGYSIDQQGNIPRNKKFEEKMVTVRASLKRLRTLVLIGQYDSFFLKSFQDILREAHNLRLLQISTASADLNLLPCSLVNPTHLRYLKVEAAIDPGALTQILRKFCHLQVLHVGSYSNPTLPVGRT